MPNILTKKAVAGAITKESATQTLTAINAAPITVISQRIINVEDKNLSLQKFQASKSNRFKRKKKVQVNRFISGKADVLTGHRFLATREKSSAETIALRAVI